eukprot:11166231-Lingulodinium_polyedra.AAC.1
MASIWPPSGLQFALCLPPFCFSVLFLRLASPSGLQIVSGVPPVCLQFASSSPPVCLPVWPRVCL